MTQVCSGYYTCVIGEPCNYTCMQAACMDETDLHYSILHNCMSWYTSLILSINAGINMECDSAISNVPLHDVSPGPESMTGITINEVQLITGKAVLMSSF